MQVNGKEGRVCGLTLKRCLSVWDGAHAFRPVFDENDMREIEADAVIFAIGQASDLSFFPDLEKASSSRIKADPVTFGTSVWNVFAAATPSPARLRSSGPLRADARRPSPSTGSCRGRICTANGTKNGVSRKTCPAKAY